MPRFAIGSVIELTAEAHAAIFAADGITGWRARERWEVTGIGDGHYRLRTAARRGAPAWALPEVGFVDERFVLSRNQQTDDRPIVSCCARPK